MKYLHLFIIPALLIFFQGFISAQDIQLQNGRHIKTIKAGQFIEIRLPDPTDAPCNGSCIGARGQVISYTGGILKLKVYQTVEPLSEHNKSIGSTISIYKKSVYPVISYPKEDILSITKKGARRMKKYSFGESLGNMMTLFGAVHLISAPVLSTQSADDRNILIGVGVTELALGIIISTTFRQKAFITSQSCPTKKKNVKIWVLN